MHIPLCISIHTSIIIVFMSFISYVIYVKVYTAFSCWSGDRDAGGQIYNAVSLQVILLWITHQTVQFIG